MVLKSIRLISSVNNGLSGITQLGSIAAVKYLSRPGKMCLEARYGLGKMSGIVEGQKVNLRTCP